MKRPRAPCTDCPQEVEWRRIRWNPLLRVMRTIHFNSPPRIIIPAHLQEDDLCEYEIVIEYNDNVTPNESEEAVNDCGLAWDSIDSETRIILGGSVFRRKNQKGYWILRMPCIYCYCDRADHNASASELIRCSVQTIL